MTGVELKVRLVGRSEFVPPDGVPFDTDADGGEALVEFAGRACYESWDRPRPSTATNAGFLRHVIDVGHTSVLEHATATLYLTGVSHPAAHEVLRHRHLSVSELSPRQVPPDPTPYVEPPAVAADPDLHAAFTNATEAARTAYDELRTTLADRAASGPGTAALQAKRARQVARAVLPSALETRLVVTGNLRAWRHFVAMRATDQADAELRELAVACLEVLREATPHVFADFTVSTLPDGTRVATSVLVAD